MEFDYKNVDWKLVKEEWDKSPMWFNLIILHQGIRLYFKPGLDKSKRFKLNLWIDGYCKSEWLDAKHEYHKYLHQKVMYPPKKMIELERKFDPKMKKKTDKQVIEEKGMFVHNYGTTLFSNISQIKKMVTALD